MSNYILSLPTKIERRTFRDLSFFLKRDDLMHPILGGNKGRKLSFLLELEGIDRLISYGSLHSNAMVALAYIANLRGWRFEYHARYEPASLQNAAGNLKKSLELGMVLRPLEEFTYYERRNRLAKTIVREGSLIVPEGGRCQEAAIGIEVLAREIVAWAEESGIEPLIFLPSGTGTTALFLQRFLPFRVASVACVGSSQYLREQFFLLDANSANHPLILEPPRRYRFGRLSKELWDLWCDLCQTSGVTFDLLYDPIGFATLLHHRPKAPILYIHQGGLGGNETMIARYKGKFGKIHKT